MVTVLVLTKKHPCDLYIFEMVAFNAGKKKKSLSKNLHNSLPSEKKRHLHLYGVLLGGLRWLSKKPLWKNKGRSGRQI